MVPQPQVHPETREQWRAWLEEHAAASTGVWLVSWRPATGRPATSRRTLSYEEAVEEALCFGWVDSTAQRIDDDRTALRFSPRRRGSGWARTNKARIERLELEGRLAEAGRRVVADARADGSWNLLDAVENLEVPDDLARAMAERPPARANFDAFPPSARRAVLAWIVQAKRPETRRRRIVETARLAQSNQRAR